MTAPPFLMVKGDYFTGLTASGIIRWMKVHDQEMREIMISIIDMLLERKEKHFSDNKRFILDYHITETDNRVDLDVVSTLPKGYNPDL